MTERIVEAAGRALAFCAEVGDSSLEGLIDRTAWELQHECGGEFASLAFIIRRHDGSSFVGRSREVPALPVETLLGLLVEEGGARVSCRVRDHALDTVRFIDARFRTSILVRITMPRAFLPEGEAALWVGLQGVATPKKVELAQTVGQAVSRWLHTYLPVVQVLRRHDEHLTALHTQVLEMTSAAHDARAPIGALKYLIADVKASHPEILPDIHRLRGELSYVDTLLGKLSPKQSEIQPAPEHVADVPTIVRRVVDRFSPQIAKRNGGFVLVVPPASDLKANIAELDLERVLSNIVGNAVRYAGSGEIAIQAERPRSGFISVSVSDRGPGIPDAILHELSKPTASGKSLQGTHGWGVGLVSCRERVVAAGGNLKIRTSEVGSTITVTLPESVTGEEVREGGATFHRVVDSPARKKTERVMSEDKQTRTDLSEPHLVLIDDDSDHTASLVRVLNRADISTRIFTEVQPAVSYIRSCGHCRVVCDAHMPDGGAEKLLRSLAAEGISVDCSVMSGEAGDDLQYWFAALGAREFFAKPVDLPRLIAWAYEDIDVQAPRVQAQL